MTTLTADESKREYIRVLGPELGETFDALRREIAFLNLKWNEYTELYGTSPARIDIVNDAAPHFFGVLQATLLDDALLHIARLTDRADHGAGRENLTVCRLPEMVDTHARPAVEQACSAAVDAAAFCRELRNKRLAHTSLPHALGRAQLDGASRHQVTVAVKSIGDAMNSVLRAYKGGSILFEHISVLGGVELLLDVLEAGSRARQEEFDRRHPRRHPGPAAST